MIKIQSKAAKTFASYRLTKAQHVVLPQCVLKEHVQVKKQSNLIDEVLAGLVWSA